MLDPGTGAEKNAAPQSTIQRALTLFKIDVAPAHRPPSAGRVVLSTVLSIGGSLLITALLVSVGSALSSSTTGYAHFQFSYFAKVTVIGVVIACAAWPVVTRISSAPRWLFLRLAIIVTLVVCAPDLWLLARASGRCGNRGSDHASRRRSLYLQRTCACFARSSRGRPRPSRWFDGPQRSDSGLPSSNAFRPPTSIACGTRARNECDCASCIHGRPIRVACDGFAATC